MKLIKKPGFLLIAFILIIVILPYVLYIKEPNIEAKAAILIDAQSGKILYSKNENKPLAPASMSKLMTEYLVLERIRDGSLDWNDKVTISDNAVHTAGVKIEVATGDRLTVKNLFHAMVISSANNAAVALAEHIADSEENFTQLMNEKAKQLQLSSKTYFVNASGLPDYNNEESRMTALDVAKLADQLLNDFPEIVEISKLQSYSLAYDGTTITATNKMLDPEDKGLYFEGVDGLKTGFTNMAGYSFAGTAKQGEKRLISVVMGTETDTDRFKETKKLFAYGFDKFYIPFL